VHELAADFDLLDVWQFEIDGAQADFPRFVDLHAGLLGAEGESTTGAAGLLFRLRHWLGDVFGWDEGAALPIPGCAETRVADRLPEEARLAPGGGAFEPVYFDDAECLHEISNQTVHALMHMGWVQTPTGYAPEMAVYVKPRGFFGRAYMGLIDPFRHWIVYPALMKQVKRQWAATRAVPVPDAGPAAAL